MRDRLRFNVGYRMWESSFLLLAYIVLVICKVRWQNMGISGVEGLVMLMNIYRCDYFRLNSRVGERTILLCYFILLLILWSVSGFKFSAMTLLRLLLLILASMMGMFMWQDRATAKRYRRTICIVSEVLASATWFPALQPPHPSNPVSSIAQHTNNHGTDWKMMSQRNSLGEVETPAGLWLPER